MNSNSNDSSGKANPQRHFRGRGSSLELKNRFERVHVELDLEQLEPQDQLDELDRKIETEYYFDDTSSVVSENQSPDVDFTFSLNPYRGCAHGCSYCYARPTHEYLGFNAGIDFESKIIVKKNCAALFRKWLNRPTWKTKIEPVMLSGVTDCYQPCERKFELTRECLKIALAMRQPIRITTKNSLISRDLDLLREMAKLNLIVVTISLASLNQSLVRIMEPRSSSPNSRLRVIQQLAEAGVPVKTLVAPIIPAINDQEIPAILEQVSNSGARSAGYVMLRLPLSVEPVFMRWLEKHFPDQVSKISGRIQSLRGGKMYDAEFGTRMKGKGIWAEQIKNLFSACCAKHSLSREIPRLNCELFRNVQNDGSSQQTLF